MLSPFKVVMIGAGSRANQVIYPAFDSLPDVEMAAICDIDLERRDKTADQYGIAKRYGEGGVFDYQKMIREIQPDAVVCVGQPHIMYDIWAWVLDQGLDLMIEKPFALTIHQAKSLLYRAEKNRCITQVSFQRRQTPMVKLLREKCLERGPVTHAVCRFYKCEATPFIGARDHMMDDTVHSIDTLRWMCGGNDYVRVREMHSEVKRVGTPDINFISATLQFENGSNGYLINSWSSGKREFSVEMHAPGIYVNAEHETFGMLYRDGDLTGERYDTREVAGSDAFFVYTGVQNVARDFVDGCRSRRQPLSSFGDALHTMEIAEKILAQATLEGC